MRARWHLADLGGNKVRAGFTKKKCAPARVIGLVRLRVLRCSRQKINSEILSTAGGVLLGFSVVSAKVRVFA